MTDNKEKNIYDDGNIPEIDLPQNNAKDSTNHPTTTEPLPESSRPRKDGPGGNQQKSYLLLYRKGSFSIQLYNMDISDFY